VSGFWDDAEIISVYTRAQAIEDGVLVDVSEMAKEAGFVVPVAVTTAVWHLIEPTDEERAVDQQDLDGRLWDVLWMARCCCAVPRAAAPYERRYPVRFRFRGRQRPLAGLRKMTLKLVSHPGDHGEHVITIMLPEED
jgi:hypothetical protein